MERKIGETFEYNGEWYQCLEEKTCTCFGCDFRGYNCADISLKEVKGSCQLERRKDNKSVIFKKLKKVGEPFKSSDFDDREDKLNLKPFDLEAAKAGKTVCTRDGRKARIICFDRINGDYYKIVACVTAFDGDFEEVLFYGIDGYIVDSQNPKDEDLMIRPEKKKGWILLRKDGCVFDNEEVAKKNCTDDYFVAKVEWEE